MSTQKKDIYRILVFCYIVSLGFQSLFDWPYFEKKIQLPEIFFVGIFFLFIFDCFKKRKTTFLHLTRFDQIILLFPLAVLLSCLVNGGTSTWIEWIGVVYLFLTYFLFKNIFCKWSLEEAYELLFLAIMWGGALIAISCWIGWGMLYFFETPNTLSFVYKNYPYFGDVIRVKGCLPSPHMVASMLNISILFFFSKIFFKKTIQPIYILFFVVIISAYFLTFAKVVILLLLAIGLLFYQKNKDSFSSVIKKSIFFFYPLLIAFYLFAIHFLIIKKEDVKSGKFKIERTHTGTSIAETDHFYIYPTSYAALKKSAFLLGKENPIFGIGLGNHESYLEGLKKEGKYPQHMPNYAPHSTYLGAFAELGGIGLVAVTFIFLSIGRRLIKIPKSYSSNILLHILIAIFFLAAVEGISTDILNFRHYWLMLAAAALFFENKISTSQAV